MPHRSVRQHFDWWLKWSVGFGALVYCEPFLSPSSSPFLYFPTLCHSIFHAFSPGQDLAVSRRYLHQLKQNKLPNDNDFFCLLCRLECGFQRGKFDTYEETLLAKVTSGFWGAPGGVCTPPRPRSGSLSSSRSMICVRVLAGPLLPSTRTPFEPGLHRGAGPLASGPPGGRFRGPK